MPSHSQNVTDYPNFNTIFQVWTFREAGDLKQSFQRLCALVQNLNNSVYNRFPGSRTSCVLGIGHDAWKKLQLQEPLPKELLNFEAINGAKHSAVSTPGDLHVHLRADNNSICVDMAIEISKVLSAVADISEEVHGFKYWDSRSILGFVDGTENPRVRTGIFLQKLVQRMRPMKVEVICSFRNTSTI